MIIKMSQRNGASNLAKHLLSTAEGQVVTVHELKGFLVQGNDLKEALNEIHQDAKANKRIKKPLVSISFNPPANEVVKISDFERAINRAEKKLGLMGQPRSIVFHEKEGRRHAHAVWSRVDENIKAIKIPFGKKTLTTLSRVLYRAHGWQPPKGFRSKKRKQVDYDLADNQQAKRNKLNPKEIKQRLINCWKNTDDLKSFKQALYQEGYLLAKGDKRNVILLVDVNGDIKSLRRTLSIKTSEINNKLGTCEHLPTVDAAKTLIVQQDILRQKQLELITKNTAQFLPYQKAMDDQVISHKKARKTLLANQAQRQHQERKTRQAQHQKGLKALFHFVTGRTQKLKQKHEVEYQRSLVRDRAEQDSLIEKQLDAREKLYAPITALKTQHQAQMHLLNRRFMQSLETLGLSEAFAIEQQQKIAPLATHKITQGFEL